MIPSRVNVQSSPFIFNVECSTFILVQKSNGAGCPTPFYSVPEGTGDAFRLHICNVHLSGRLVGRQANPCRRSEVVISGRIRGLVQ